LTTTTKCIHHWLIEKPSGPFSIQTCKKCGETDAARNYLNDVGWSRREGTKMEDFADEEDRKLYLNEHLKEKIIEEKKNSHIVPTKKIRVVATYEDDIKFKVLMDTDLFSIAETSRRNCVPTSTISDWKRQYSNYQNVKDSDNRELFKRVVVKKVITLQLNDTEVNVTQIAREYDIPRRTLRDWLNT